MLNTIKILGGFNFETLTNTPLGTAWSDPASIVTSIINLLTFIGVAVAVVYLIISGIRWITSGAEEGKKGVINALIGLTVVVAAFFLVTFVVAFLKNQEILPGIQCEAPFVLNAAKTACITQ